MFTAFFFKVDILLGKSCYECFNNLHLIIVEKNSVSLKRVAEKYDSNRKSIFSVEINTGFKQTF